MFYTDKVGKNKKSDKVKMLGGAERSQTGQNRSNKNKVLKELSFKNYL